MQLQPQFFDPPSEKAKPADGVYRLLRTGILVGLFVSVLVFPLVVMGGLSTKAGVNAIDQLSVELAETNPPLTSYVYAADGETLVSLFYDEFRRHVDLDEIAPVMQQSIMAAEDARFYEHNGVDYRGVLRAAVANQATGEVEQGASTLTMQYVRGALQHNAESIDEVIDATEETVDRKLREARLAMALEDQLTKDEILERYLNQAYFGHNAYGIFAAAYIYFSKHPSELELSEAALLAGLVQAPSEYDPVRSDQTQAQERRDWVLDRMIENDFISDADASEVVSTGIELDVSNPPNSCIGITGEISEHGFFCDYLRLWWRTQDAFGDTPQERETNLRQGGYTVISTLDPDMHDVAADHVNDQVSPDSEHAMGAILMEPGTGRIKSLALNRQYSLDQSDNGPHSNPSTDQRGNYPNTVNALLGGGNASGYQGGSTFKVFVMLAALDDGYTLDHSIDSPHTVTTGYITAGGRASCGGRWCPSNANESMAGNRDMWSGYGMSVNTYFAQLIQQVGADKSVEMAERMGLEWRTETDRLHADPDRRSGWGPFTLGVSDVQPIEMTNVFNTLAGDGQYCEPLPVLRVIDPDGQELDVASPRCRQELDEDVARAANDAGLCTTETHPNSSACGEWGTAGDIADTVEREVAGKTGTTDSHRAAWFFGSTPQLTVGTFMADPDYMFNTVGESRASLPRETAAVIIRDALEDEPALEFERPSSSIRG